MSEDWVSGTAPSVPPDRKFRADLHRALEETHRRQSAQRQTEAHTGAWYTASGQWRWLLLAAFLAVVMGVLLTAWRRR
jgi:hypothetical protein